MNKTRLLFLTILIEGYVVLTSELLAIRQVMPFVGSGIETTAIVIAGVLLPLAIGYHYGGDAWQRAFADARATGRQSRSIRAMLLRNIFVALLFLCFGLSYLFLDFFFAALRSAGIHHRLLQSALYAALFLVTPTFLLGQTVPLISNYFSRVKLSEITGKMLFFSTAGSFLGSLFSTIVLMTTIGTHNTVIATLGLLTFLSVLLSGKKLRGAAAGCIAMLALCWEMNSGAAMRSLSIVSDNAYNVISVQRLPHEDSVIFNQNRSFSSKWSRDPEKRFEYVKYIEATFIAPRAAPASPKDILIIGAGGFTMGLDDSFNNYTYVDIDAALKDVAETHFLPEKLGPNKRFVAASARAFVHNDDKTYDLIVLDVYTNLMSIPMECTTQDFLRDVKARLRPHGIVAANIIASPTLDDKFSKRYDATFASVFPSRSRQIIGDFDAWRRPDVRAPEDNYRNIIYMFFNNAHSDDATIYTDEKNTYSLDRP